MWFDLIRDLLGKVATAFADATSSPGDSSSHVILHEEPHAHPCMDLNADGRIDVSDLLALLAAFGGPSTALYNGLGHGDTVDVIDLLSLLPDFGRDDLGEGCVTARVGETFEYLDAIVTAAAASVTGYTTYTLTASLHDNVLNLYSIEGTSDAPMEWPAAYQVPAPFGADIGGTNPLFFSIHPQAQHDSWITVGITEGSTNELATLGIDFQSWTESTPLFVEDGSCFWMDPHAAPGGDVVVGQVTVPSGSSGTVLMGMQGHATDGSDWDVHRVVFSY